MQICIDLREFACLPPRNQSPGRLLVLYRSLTSQSSVFFLWKNWHLYLICFGQLSKNQEEGHLTSSSKNSPFYFPSLLYNYIPADSKTKTFATFPLSASKLPLYTILISTRSRPIFIFHLNSIPLWFSHRSTNFRLSVRQVIKLIILDSGLDSLPSISLRKRVLLFRDRLIQRVN